MAGPSKLTGRLLGLGAPPGTLRTTLAPGDASGLLSGVPGLASGAAQNAAGAAQGASSAAQNAIGSATTAAQQAAAAAQQQAQNAIGQAQNAAQGAIGTAQGIANDPQAAATAAAVAAARQAGIAPGIVTDAASGNYQDAAILAGQQLLKSVNMSSGPLEGVGKMADYLKQGAGVWATATAIIAAAIPVISAVLGADAAAAVTATLAAIGAGAAVGSSVPVVGTVVGAIIAAFAALGSGLVQSWGGSVQVPSDPGAFYGDFEDKNMITRGNTQVAGIPGHADDKLQAQRKQQIADFVTQAAEAILNGPQPWQAAFLQNYFQLAKTALWASSPVDSFRRNTLPDELVRILGVRFLQWFIKQPGWLQALAALPTRIPYRSSQQDPYTASQGPKAWPATNLQADLVRMLPSAVLNNILEANQVPFQGPDSMQLSRYQSAVSVARNAAYAMGPAVKAAFDTLPDSNGVIKELLPIIGTYPLDRGAGPEPTPIRVHYRPDLQYVTPGSDVAGWDPTIYPVLYPGATPLPRLFGGTAPVLLKGLPMPVGAPLPSSASILGNAPPAAAPPPTSTIAPHIVAPAPFLPAGFNLGSVDAILSQVNIPGTVRAVIPVPPGGLVFPGWLPIKAPVPPTITLGQAQQTLNAAPSNSGAAAIVSGTVASAQSGHPQGIANAQVLSLAQRLQTMSAFVSKYVDPKSGMAILSGTFLLPQTQRA